MSAVRVEGSFAQVTARPPLSMNPWAVRLGRWKRAAVIAV